MRFIDADEIDAALDFPALIDALDDAFRAGWTAPTRHHHAVPLADGPEGTHLLMPAWGDGLLGVKIVNVFPGNGALGKPAVQGLYVLQDGRTGETLAVLDGSRLTVWRTAAASALAARRLARSDSRRLTLVGAGALAPFLARAHASVRAIDEITVWNHRPEGAQRLASALAAEGFRARAEASLQAAVEGADIVSAATLSTAPLIQGAWLRPGVHVDLVGAFNMKMREADDLALTRAHIFIDTPAALTEGGDVAQALASGALARSAIIADLASLGRGAPGRGDDSEITLFKSVGAAVEDLAAAALVWRRLAP
jgi:ornithine cyclodeaminase/alanine dehydrogenase-like protein (mu-crystallin family)